MKASASDMLKEFILNLKENERTGKTNVELKKSLTYTAWKKKFSELINIWELYESNGIEMKFTYKYLILKKFFISRAQKRFRRLHSGMICFYLIRISLKLCQFIDRIVR